MLYINNLQAQYQINNIDLWVLKDVSFSIGSGEIAAIIGPSGCGKTTLLKVLAGIHTFYEGEVMINAQPPSAKLHRIGFIPQHHGLLPWKTICEDVMLLKNIKDKEKKVKRHHGIKMLEELGIAHLANRFPHQISGGQRQRVAIARAFLLAPNLLLMDEPFSSLDAMTREEMQEVFLALWKKKKTTALIVTHSIEEAVYLGKKIIILSAAPGRTLEVIDNPLFGRENIRKKLEYYDFIRQLREKIKKGWSL